MFWGSYSYDKKGPCHIFITETAKEKKEADQELERLNEKRESDCKEKWELETNMRRMGLRNPPGRKPVWKWNKKNGKLVRDGKGGIDWYRYQKVG